LEERFKEAIALFGPWKVPACEERAGEHGVWAIDIGRFAAFGNDRECVAGMFKKGSSECCSIVSRQLPLDQFCVHNLGT